MCNETNTSKEFRRADGTGVAGKAFSIPLESFIPQSVQSDFLPEALEQTITIPYEKLAAYLDTAETRLELCKAEQGIADVLPAGRRKRRRESTPEEELRSEDERIIEGLEAAEARRVQERDEEWKEPRG